MRDSNTDICVISCGKPCPFVIYIPHIIRGVRSKSDEGFDILTRTEVTTNCLYSASLPENPSALIGLYGDHSLQDRKPGMVPF